MLKQSMLLRLVLVLLLIAGGYFTFQFFNKKSHSSTIAPANIVLRGGKIFTVEERQQWAEAVAVRGDTIVYVGNAEGVEPFVGPNTKVVELNGKMVLPGFVESHIHPMLSWTTLGADLQFDDPKAMLAAVKNYANANPKDVVVRGFGWRYTAFPATGPKKEDIDKIVSDRPVMLVAIDGHSAWVNSKALEIANITAQTPDPVPGVSRFERDPKTGKPTGYVIEVAAMFQLLAALAPPNPEEMLTTLQNSLKAFSKAGITAVFDAGIIGMKEEDGFAMYQSLEKAGTLPVRVVGAHYYNNPKEDPLPIIKELRRRFNSELVSATTLKINVDGGDAQYTAAMLKPYADKPNTSGDLIIPAAIMTAVVTRAHAAGINTFSHAFGDRAARVYLDAVAAARASYPKNKTRHTASHIMYLTDSDIKRFKLLDVSAQFSAQWAMPDAANLGVAIDRLGEQVVSTEFMRIGSVAAAGGRVAFGTDWPAAGYYSTFKPLEAIQVAITREMISGRGTPKRPIMPPASERITLEQALRASTINSAYILGMEDRIGSLRVGKRADLIVLNKNLFDIPPQDISKTQILLTLMNGKETFRDNAFK
ncbi:amidohydrolase [Flavobacterium sp. ABG]|uniref:amidohydrolase n=1 Tax=Flavobacterium sp. ABG TaxID=1423322 RepID=UPI0009E32E64|nr:amidohydrolase [Flavobacterium sp. ABG]